MWFFLLVTMKWVGSLLEYLLSVLDGWKPSHWSLRILGLGEDEAHTGSWISADSLLDSPTQAFCEQDASLRAQWMLSHGIALERESIPHV